MGRNSYFCLYLTKAFFLNQLDDPTHIMPIHVAIQTSPIFLKEQIALIQKVWSSYCLQKKLQLAPQAQALLFQKLLQLLQKDWTQQAEKYGATVPNASLLTEVTRLHCQTLLQDNDSQDIAWLHSQPAQLIVKYQPMIKQIVAKKVAGNDKIDSETQEDIVANIQEKLLQKIAKGKLTKQYNGTALFTTYLHKTIYHSMVDELRKLQKHDNTSLEQNEKQHSINPVNMAYMDLMEQHIRRLHIQIRMLPEKPQKRFEFSLKVMYRMNLKVTDIRVAYPHCTDALLVEILSYFGKAYHALSKKQLYNLLSVFLLELEEDRILIKPDSLRMWFQKILKKIKKSVLVNMPTEKKAALDAYFELLVYNLYKKH